jgi:eukaryotic-like serine/threonine-protein kinase
VAGRYRLVRMLGAGGMGTVWEAQDELLGRTVAIKEVAPPPELTEDEADLLRKRTVREASTAARISHPNVTTVYDVVTSDDEPWIVMELVPSRSLSEVIAADGPMPPARVAQIGLDVLAALRTAHAAGVLHRDVKPGNVLLRKSDGRAVLTDFGIATLAGDPSLTKAGLLLGAPAYISPERARGGRGDPSSDLWALGATLYTAVEGRPPHDRGGPLPTLAALVTEDPPPPRHAGDLRPALVGMLRMRPADRPSSAEIEALLRPVAASRAPHNLAVAPRPAAPPPAPAAGTAPVPEPTGVLPEPPPAQPARGRGVRGKLKPAKRTKAAPPPAAAQPPAQQGRPAAQPPAQPGRPAAHPPAPFPLGHPTPPAPLPIGRPATPAPEPRRPTPATPPPAPEPRRPAAATPPAPPAPDTWRPAPATPPSEPTRGAHTAPPAPDTRQPSPATPAATPAAEPARGAHSAPPAPDTRQPATPEPRKGPQDTPPSSTPRQSPSTALHTPDATPAAARPDTPAATTPTTHAAATPAAATPASATPAAATPASEAAAAQAARPTSKPPAVRAEASGVKPEPAPSQPEAATPAAVPTPPEATPVVPPQPGPTPRMPTSSGSTPAVRPEPARPEPDRPEPDRPEPARPEPARQAPAGAAAAEAGSPAADGGPAPATRAKVPDLAAALIPITPSHGTPAVSAEPHAASAIELPRQRLVAAVIALVLIGVLGTVALLARGDSDPHNGAAPKPGTSTPAASAPATSAPASSAPPGQTTKPAGPSSKLPPPASAPATARVGLYSFTSDDPTYGLYSLGVPFHWSFHKIQQEWGGTITFGPADGHLILLMDHARTSAPNALADLRSKESSQTTGSNPFYPNYHKIRLDRAATLRQDGADVAVWEFTYTDRNTGVPMHALFTNVGFADSRGAFGLLWRGTRAGWDADAALRQQVQDSWKVG